MSVSRAFAYNLVETENGWSWRIVDRDGHTIDAGFAADKVAARAAIHRVIGPGAAAPPALARRSWRNLIRAFSERARRSFREIAGPR